MQAALLPHRGVVKVVGDDARRFLNGLVTSDMTKVSPGHPRFAALLTPQGKIIVDFLILQAPSDSGAWVCGCCLVSPAPEGRQPGEQAGRRDGDDLEELALGPAPD